jgi:hypothetical protein
VNGTPTRSRRDEALLLAEELLGEIELGRIEPVAVVRKASRLARLLDDVEAMRWLAFESTGFPTGPLDAIAWSAAERSCRTTPSEDAESPATADTTLLGQIAAQIESAKVELSSGQGGISSSQYAVIVERERANRLTGLHRIIAERTRLLDRVVGAIHLYVASCYQELRFGSAVETAFSVVRDEVDGAIASLVPDLLPMIAAAFENASSDNPEHWQNAASTCRRLLMTAADSLRPPGPDANGRKMGPGNYVNRLVDWIVGQATSETEAGMIMADLNYLGPRLDAADAAGQKGAHVGAKPVGRVEASRYVTGTYLVLGDILRVRDTAASTVEQAVEATAEAIAGTDAD